MTDQPGLQPRSIYASDVDGTIFKSSLTAKMVRAGIASGIFRHEQFEQVLAYERHWQRHNTEQNYVAYLSALVDAFVQAVQGLEASKFVDTAHNMLHDQTVRRFGFTSDLRWLLRDTHTFVGISGSPTILVEPFLHNLQPDYVFGSTLEIVNDRFTRNATNVEPKDRIIQGLSDQGAVRLAGSVMVGDTISDARMLELADFPIMFNPSATLRDYGTPRGWHWVTETKDNITYLEPCLASSGTTYDYRVRPVAALFDNIFAASSQTA